MRHQGVGRGRPEAGSFETRPRVSGGTSSSFVPLSFALGQRESGSPRKRKRNRRRRSCLVPCGVVGVVWCVAGVYLFPVFPLPFFASFRWMKPRRATAPRHKA